MEIKKVYLKIPWVNKFTTYVKENNDIIEKSYNTPFKTTWTCKSLIIDDQENWHGHEDLVGFQTIFKSVNKILPIKAELLGPQILQMDCMDIYGNMLRNNGEGVLYVKGTGKPVINRKE